RRCGRWRRAAAARWAAGRARAPSRSTGAGAAPAAGSPQRPEAVEDGPEPLDVTLRAERLVQPRLVQLQALAGGLLAERLAESGTGLPGLHRGRLDQGVGALAG